MKIAVVGGGVIGLCCAYALERGGADVTIIEGNSCGAAASLGNAGWVTPGLSAPLPAPGVMRQALKWMFRPDSPFLIRPRLDPAFLSWCWHFGRHCSSGRYEAGTRAMLALNHDTIALFDELQAAGLRFEMHSDGLVFLSLSEHHLGEWIELFDRLREYGYEGEVEPLDRAALRDLEPAVSDAVVGGLHAKTERFVRPESLTRALVERLRERSVSILEQTEVRGLVRDSTAGWRLVTAGQDVVADRVVVAAGVWSKSVLAELGVRIPLEAAKGYSITASGSGTKPAHALYLTEAKVGCSPFEAGVRLAGTLELVGIDVRLNRKRLNAITRAASIYLADWTPADAVFEWAGLRPFAPDGLPLIGSVPGVDGVYLATGHGMLGVTLGPATGFAVAPLVLHNRLVPELEPFRIERPL